MRYKTKENIFSFTFQDAKSRGWDCAAFKCSGSLANHPHLSQTIRISESDRAEDHELYAYCTILNPGKRIGQCIRRAERSSLHPQCREIDAESSNFSRHGRLGFSKGAHLAIVDSKWLGSFHAGKTKYLWSLAC